MPTARFDAFEANLSTGELRKRGQRIPLQEQPFQILRLLLEAAPEPVTREQIIAALWSAETFVDFDIGVNTAVRKLRLALNDSVDHPQFVHTLAKRGYRFIAPVEWIHEAPAVTSVIAPADPAIVPRQEPFALPPASPRAASHSAHARWIKPVLLLLLIVAASSLFLWSIRRKTSLERRAPLIAIPLTSLPGTAAWPSFSPDGRQVVFAWDPKNTNLFQVYLQSVSASAQPFQLTRQYPLAIPPVWSPDGLWIAYGRYHHVEGKKDIEIVLIPAPVGGHEIVVESSYEDFGGLSWSPDSRYLAFPDRPDPAGPIGLVLFDRNTSQKRQLTSPPKTGGSSVGDINPVFSPDGTRIAFVRSPIVGMNQLAMLTLASGKIDIIQTDQSSDSLCGVLTWDVDGRSLVYASDRNGISQLWRVPISGGTPEPLSVGEDATSLTVSRSSHRLAFTRAFNDVNIWQAEITPRNVTRSPLIVASRLDFQPALSPDESKIAFTSDRSGFDEIWVANRDGSDPVQITPFRRHKTGTPQWSPDSRRIAFDARVNGHAEIYVVSLDGSVPQPLTHDGFENAVPSWSPNGQEIYYSSMQSGDAQIWKLDLAGGPPIRITQYGGVRPLLSPDGRTLYYIKTGSANELWQKLLPDGEERVVPGLPGIPDYMSYQVVSNGVYFTTPTAGYAGWNLQFYDFVTQKTHTVIPLRSVEFPGISVSKDGHRIFYAQVDNAGANIMLVENYN